MDPVACWLRLVDALVEGDINEARDAAEDLARWIAHGGVAPFSHADALAVAHLLSPPALDDPPDDDFGYDPNDVWD